MSLCHEISLEKMFFIQQRHELGYYVFRFKSARNIWVKGWDFSNGRPPMAKAWRGDAPPYSTPMLLPTDWSGKQQKYNYQLVSKRAYH